MRAYSFNAEICRQLETPVSFWQLLVTYAVGAEGTLNPEPPNAGCSRGTSGVGRAQVSSSTHVFAGWALPPLSTDQQSCDGFYRAGVGWMCTEGCNG